MNRSLRLVKSMTVAALLLVMSGVVLAAPMTVGGTVKSVAASGKSITVTIGSGGSAKSESFGVTASTKVTLDDKEAKLSELKPGSKVTISYDKSSKDAVSIKAHSATNESSKPENSAAPAKTNAKDAPPPAWTMELAKMQIPEAPVIGKIHGQPFKLEKVELQGSVLELRQGKDFFPDLALKIFLPLKADESVEGKTIRVTSKDGFSSPQIHKQYRGKPGEGLPETEFITEKYAMLLQFGKAQDGAISGKIFVSLPDKSQSFVAGSFTLGGADAGVGTTASLISGKIEYRGTERNFDAFVGCLGKNSEGKLESPGAGFPVSLDEPSSSATCLSWKPRNTTLAWDKKIGLSHKHTNRPAGHYLVFVKNEKVFFDSKWVELKDDSSKVTADLSIDPAKLGSVEVSWVGRVPKDSWITCVPLDEKGELPLAAALAESSFVWAPIKANIDNGPELVGKFRDGKFREGKYQFGLLGAKVVAEIKAGVTTKVELEPPRPKRVEVVEFSSAGGATLTKLFDGSILVSGTNPAKDTYTIVATSDLKKITGLRLEALKDDSLPNRGPGRLANGTFILTRVEIKAAPKGSRDAPKPVAIAKAIADFTQQGHSATNLIDGKPGPGWAIWNNGTASHQVDFEFDKPLTFETGTTLTVTLKHESQWAGGNLGYFRLSVSSGQDK